MFTAASSTALIASAFSTTGTILTATMSTVVIALVALLGLGFAVRHLRKYITGKKF